MAIVQSSTFTGVDYDDVRPGARPRLGVMQTAIAKDQALAFEAATGLAVPNAGSISATPHTHDGANGVVIPIPLVQQNISASLRSWDSLGIYSALQGYSAFHAPIFFAPAGVSSVRVVLYVDDVTAAEDYRELFQIRSYDSSLTVIDQVPIEGAEELYDGIWAIWADVDVNQGEINFLWLMSWDGYTYPGSERVIDEQRNRIIYGYTVLPHAGAWTPQEVYRLADRPVAALTTTPATNQHLASRAYTSKNDHMFSDDYGVSSYALHGMALNDVLLTEKITGAAFSADPHLGHAHDGDAGYAKSDKGGAVMDSTLGAWSFGVCRARDASPTDLQTQDCLVPSKDRWGGRIHALHLIAGTTTTPAAHLRFRMPEVATIADIHGSGKLKFAALIATDAVKDGYTSTVTAKLYDSTMANVGSTLTFTISTGGTRQVISGSIDMWGSAASVGAEAVLEISLGRSATTDTTGIYSCCVYLEA